MKRPFRLAGFIGVIAMFLGLTTGYPVKNLMYTCPPHFKNPILALEFVSTQPELETLFGTEKREEKMEAMRKSQNFDFLFILGYMAFLAAFALTIYKQTGQKRYWLLAALAILIGLADILENGAIKILMDKLQATSIPIDDYDFTRLHLFTWTKWLGLALFFAAGAVYLRSTKTVLGWILALGGALIALMGLIARFSPAWIETFVGKAFFYFPLIILFCFLYKTPTPDTTNDAGLQH